MKIRIKFLFLLTIIFLLGKSGHTQENYASNVKTNISEDKVLITYDITPTDGSKSFSVILIMTYEGSQVKASSVYGDIGSNISPGTEKAIVWYYKTDFEGDIQKVNISVYVNKENEPQAIFEIVSISNNSYAPCEATFLNKSSYANEYQWDFGDPDSGVKNISFEKDPKHTYEKGGIYSIALIARNTQSKLENKYYQSIEVKTHEATIADFEIEGNNQQPPANVKFINKSVNGDVFKWNFGDPSSKKKNESDKKDADHKYTQPGVYTVELTVKNNFSRLTDQVKKDVVIEEQNLPQAKFIYDQSSVTAPSTVVFKNTSLYSSKYEWDFGDPASGNSNTSTETDPVHIYQNPGSFNVTLSAYGSAKKPAKFSEVITIKEMPKPPEARFSIKNNNVLGPATIVFINNSLNATTYSWDFGDPESGGTNFSDKENPTHTYTNGGRYKVVLTTSSENFVETSTASDYVVITEPSNPPAAKFSIVNNNVQEPANISFSNESENADDYLWDFGDSDSGNNSSAEQSPSHNYIKAGRYKVVLVATNSKSGEKSTFSDYVIITAQAKTVIKPVAKFTIVNNNKPGPVTVSFVNASTDAQVYSWKFGDPSSGENTSVLKDPTHTYATPGTYKVELTVKNENSGTTEAFSDFVIVAQPVEPVIRPVAKFDIGNANTDSPFRMSFTNVSADADMYEWNFGDPESSDNVSNKSNPVHTFSKPGRYSVELKATNKSSGLTNTYSQFVNINAPVVVTAADFEIQNNNAVEPATIAFKNTSENANSYAWNFDDPSSGENNTSTLENPQHVYNRAGEYNVVLAVLNKESGKEDIIRKTVVVEKRAEPP
ncbi:MAG: PKD domain-containing protein, partial [Prolixibacteraceae bacterium]|nr:PKD domain-containing protein [Prolixibacteraceae bacterium]